MSEQAQEQKPPTGEELYASYKELPEGGRKIMDKVIALMLRHQVQVNTLEADNAALRTQLAAAERKAALADEIAIRAKAVEREIGVPASVVGVSQTWMQRYDALSRDTSSPKPFPRNESITRVRDTSSDPHSDWVIYTKFDANCEHDWRPIKSTKDACLKCKAQRKSRDTSSEEAKG